MRKKGIPTSFVQEILSLYVQRFPWFLSLLGEHLALSAVAILLAGAIGLALGLLIARLPALAPAVLGVANLFYTIPSIALLGLLIPFFGIGNSTAIAALTLYGIMPMVRNTYTGLTTTDPDILEAARGMGSTESQLLLRVRLPLAAGVIMAGVRNMVVMTISVTAIASFIGAGGLGVAIYRGITVYNPAMTFAGSLLIAALALLADFLLGLCEKQLKKRGL